MKLFKKIFLFFCSYVLICYANAQTSIENIDGKKYVVLQSFWNDKIEKQESSATDYISMYQKYISGIRSQECPMYPSCSNFGMKTFTESNFVTAMVLTSDRLLRCGHDHKNYALTLRPNGFKFIDYPGNDTPPNELYYSRNAYFFAYADSIKNDSTFLFINKLINNGYCQEALLEIMRIEFSSPFNIELFINKIICLRAIGEYEKALFEFETKCLQEHKQNPELLFQIALIHYKLQNYGQALLNDSVALIFCNDSFLLPKIIALNGLIYANRYEWLKSLQSFNSLSGFEMYRRVSSANIKLAEKAFQFKNKNPTIAVVLSTIIPGLGYAYTRHKQTAVSALIVNGLLTFATYSNFDRKNYGMGTLTGVFNVSFYIANIYGSSQSAKRYNKQQKKNIISKLEYNVNF